MSLLKIPVQKANLAILRDLGYTPRETKIRDNQIRLQVRNQRLDDGYNCKERRFNEQLIRKMLKRRSIMKIIEIIVAILLLMLGTVMVWFSYEKAILCFILANLSITISYLEEASNKNDKK